MHLYLFCYREEAKVKTIIVIIFFIVIIVIFTCVDNGVAIMGDGDHGTWLSKNLENHRADLSNLALGK